jgi:hypothetical protein
MGYAQGQLQSEYVNNFVNSTYTYIITQAADSWPSDFFSPAVKDLIIEFGIAFALDWNIGVTKPFTPQSYYDEIRGIADAAGMDYQTLLRLNMFPEITKASCSFFGAWKRATVGGKTMQLRALDYDTDGPFKDFPQITVYHPSIGKAFANVGWPGQVGALTGMADGKMAISEIGVSFPDDSFGQGTPDTPAEIVDGKPWMFVLRDVLQFSTTLDEALSSVKQSNRTCNLIIGVGDGNNEIVNGIEYGGRVFQPYNDTTLLPVNNTWHPQVPDVVYNGMDWLCPGYTSKLGGELAKYHGSISPQIVVGNILPTVQTGNLHIAVYDLTDNFMHVSFCRNSTAPVSEPLYAYERQFTSINMTSIFATSLL